MGTAQGILTPGSCSPGISLAWSFFVLETVSSWCLAQGFGGSMSSVHVPPISE